MSMVLDTRESNFVNQQWLQFHIWFIMTLYYKMQQILLQNATTILSKKCDKNLLRNESVLLKYKAFAESLGRSLSSCKIL